MRGTVRENLLLGTDITDERIEEVMTAVDLRPGSVELPDGLDTQLSSGGAGQLSGGQRQRLALAHMLCRPAEVYVVDDCDSSLDSQTARAAWERPPALWHAAWIIVSHNRDLIAAADTVVTVGRPDPLPFTGATDQPTGWPYISPSGSAISSIRAPSGSRR